MTGSVHSSDRTIVRPVAYIVDETAAVLQSGSTAGYKVTRDTSAIPLLARDDATDFGFWILLLCESQPYILRVAVYWYIDFTIDLV